MAAVAGTPYLQDDPDALAAGPEFDPNAIAAGAPGPAPVPMPGAPGVTTEAPPDPTVLSPLGQVPQSAIPGPPPTADAAAPAPAPPGPDVAAAPPAAPGQAPAPALPALGAPPPRPPLTGDPEKDTQANLEWSRQADAWHANALAHQSVIDTKKAAVQASEADQEAKAAAVAETQRQQLQAQAAARRAENQKAIDQSVQERMAAQKDLETKDPMTGGKIVALIAGALGAARQDMASAQMGHPTVHPNAAMEVMNQMAATEYERKKNRLANASEALLQARYGYKDSEDNHRAALNDLDADTSAHYKLIAKEAESQLRAAGAGSAEIASNEIVNQANQKAAEYENGIHLREEEVQNKGNLDKSIIEKNLASAERQRQLAESRANAHGGTGHAAGPGKAATKAQTQELKDIEAAAKPSTSVIMGSARSPGVKTSYESAVAVSNELRRAAETGDPDTMKIAVMHAQEQSTRFLTGAAPTQQTFEIQHQLAGEPEQLEAKFGGLVGRPTEAKSYVLRMAQNIDAISKQRKEVMEAERGSLQTRLDSIIKSEEGHRRAGGIMDQLFGKPEAEKPQRKTIGGNTVYERGPDGNWHLVK